MKAPTPAVIFFYLPVSGTWKAVPFLFQPTTIASSPAAWISLSLRTSVTAPSPSPHSSFLTDPTTRRAAMWVQRESFRICLHNSSLFLNLYSHGWTRTHLLWNIWTIQPSGKKRGLKQNLTQHLGIVCSHGFLFFNVRVCVGGVNVHLM